MKGISFRGRSVLNGHLGKSFGGTDPDVVLVVFYHRQNIVMKESVLLPKNPECFAGWIEQVEAAMCTDPYQATAVLDNRHNAIVADRRRIFRVVEIMNKTPRLFFQNFKTIASSNP